MISIALDSQKKGRANKKTAHNNKTLSSNLELFKALLDKYHSNTISKEAENLSNEPSRPKQTFALKTELLTKL